MVKSPRGVLKLFEGPYARPLPLAQKRAAFDPAYQKAPQEGLVVVKGPVSDVLVGGVLPEPQIRELSFKCHSESCATETFARLVANWFLFIEGSTTRKSPSNSSDSSVTLHVLFFRAKQAQAVRGVLLESTAAWEGVEVDFSHMGKTTADRFLKSLRMMDTPLNDSIRTVMRLDHSRYFEYLSACHDVVPHVDYLYAVENPSYLRTLDLPAMGLIPVDSEIVGRLQKKGNGHTQQGQWQICEVPDEQPRGFNYGWQGPQPFNYGWQGPFFT